MTTIQHTFQITSTEGIQGEAVIVGLKEATQAKAKAVHETLKKNPGVRIFDPVLKKTVFLVPEPPKRSGSPPKKTPR